jgi:hypothetical protein
MARLTISGRRELLDALRPVLVPPGIPFRL